MQSCCYLTDSAMFHRMSIWTIGAVLFFKKINRPTAGEELLVGYRYSVTRQTLWDFGLGVKLPKVISEYLASANEDGKDWKLVRRK